MNTELKEGIEELESLCDLLFLVIPEKFYRINLSIARGLGYYTGIVYETILEDLPDLGSVCSGGRYDNLTQNFSKETLSGVGASIGLDRLLAGLEELGLIAFRETPADVLVISLHTLGYAYKSAASLRDLDLKVEVYPEIVKPKKAFQYAHNKGYEWVIVLGEEEESKQKYSLKNMQTGIQDGDLSLLAVYEKISSC